MVDVFSPGNLEKEQEKAKEKRQNRLFSRSHPASGSRPGRQMPRRPSIKEKSLLKMD
jgi:hypothetical protein